MLVTRTLSLALATLAALAFTATANAQVEVVNEATAEHCSDVVLGANHNVSGGCEIHVTSETETQFVAGTAGGPVVVFACEDEFDAHIDNTGEGYIDVADIRAHPLSPCTRTQCDEPAPSHAGIPWRIHIRENPDVANLSFCLRSSAVSAQEGSSGTPCTVNVPFTTDATGHHPELNAESGAPCTNLALGAITVHGHWHAEEDGVIQDIRIVH